MRPNLFYYLLQLRTNEKREGVIVDDDQSLESDATISDEDQSVESDTTMPAPAPGQHVYATTIYKLLRPNDEELGPALQGILESSFPAA